MTPDDPSRRRLGGTPNWADSEFISLPSLTLTPAGPRHWRVQFLFPDPDRTGYAFFYLWQIFEQGAELDLFLTAWWTSPEDTVRIYFGREPPKGKAWHVAKALEVAGETTQTLAELGL